MPKIIALRLKPEILAKYGLPDIEYPVNVDALDASLEENDEMPFAEMLYDLQERSRGAHAYWKGLAPAMNRLAQILAPEPDDREIYHAVDENWHFEIGPVDLLNGQLVSMPSA